MAEKDRKKKHWSKIVRELYLYPFKSKSENGIRIVVLVVSWLVGIFFQRSADYRAIGGAYFVFACSLLLEFPPNESRTKRVAMVVHGLFSLLMFSMVVLSFGLVIDSDVTDAGLLRHQQMADALFYMSWTVIIFMGINLLLRLLDTDKLIYNEAEQAQAAVELQHDEVRAMFESNLRGQPKGGEWS